MNGVDLPGTDRKAGSAVGDCGGCHVVSKGVIVDRATITLAQMRARAYFYIGGAGAATLVSWLPRPRSPPPGLSTDETDAWFGVPQRPDRARAAVDAELLAAHRLSCSSHEVL